MSTSRAKSIKWVEGLRGIASALVIATHVARAFDFALFWPADDLDAHPRLLQLPFLRLPWQGRIGVPVFAFLTGFVCAFKPLKLAGQNGDSPAALHAVARSAFRRVPRLMLPAAVATIFGFFISAFGFYRTANRVDSFWVRLDAPDNLPLGENIWRMLDTLLTTWTSGDNRYDPHLWAMRRLLVGAFQVYMVLAATMGMRFKYRITVHVLVLAYWLVNTGELTETFGALLAFGTLLCDLSLHRPTQAWIVAHKRILSCVVTPLLFLVGGYVGSYPGEHEDYLPWSRHLHRVLVDPAGDGSRGSLIVPHGSDIHRRTSAFFVQCVALGIFLSPPLREALSHPLLLWMGQHSFAVYLVHGTILRTVAIWISYGFSGEPWDPAAEGEEQEWLHPLSSGHMIAAIPVFVVLTYLAAWAWMRWVDTSCASMTQWLESRVFVDEERIGGSNDAEQQQQHPHHHGDENGDALANGSSKRTEDLAEKGFAHLAIDDGHTLLSGMATAGSSTDGDGGERTALMAAVYGSEAPASAALNGAAGARQSQPVGSTTGWASLR